jgi:hypothetical protein
VNGGAKGVTDFRLDLVMTSKKSTQATLESTLLHGGAFSADLLNSILLNFVDKLKKSLDDDADDALICVVEDEGDVAMLLIDWDGTVLQNKQAFDRMKQMWRENFATNTRKLIPEFVDHLQHGMLGVVGVKWIATPN